MKIDLPFELGETVYYTSSMEVIQMTVKEIDIILKNNEQRIEYYLDKIYSSVPAYEYGQRLFKTYAEAKAALDARLKRT